MLNMVLSPTYAFLLAFIMITDCNAIEYRFDYKYSQKAGGWLKYHEMPTTWDDARSICHAEGAVLVSPLNKNVQLEMTRLITIQNNTCGIFAGIHATFAKGIFTSVEGVPLSKIPVEWASDEPDNFENNEDCLMMLPNGTMADVKCGDVFPFICFRDKSKKNIITACGTFDTRYDTLDARTGSCYKFHAMGQTWDKAFMTCASEGAYLAIINSDKEAQALKDLFAKYPAKRIPTMHKDMAQIGFRKWNGGWFTIHGDTLRESGYSTWNVNQPNELIVNGVEQSCGVIQREAKLNDMWCNERVAFICEKSPDSLYTQSKEDESL